MGYDPRRWWPMLVEGRIYGAQTTADDSDTTLLDLTAPGAPVTARTEHGFISGVARIR